MSAPLVTKNPAAFDVFLLDGDPCPGISEIESGGDAADDIQDQRQLLTKGATTVDRGWINAEVTYRLTLMNPVDLAKWLKWEAMFLEGRRRVPNPRSYLFQDLRQGWIKRVIFQKMSPQRKKAPGGPWERLVTLHEYNRPAPIGGPIKPVDALDKIITGNESTIKALEKQLAGAVAASKAAGRAGK